MRRVPASIAEAGRGFGRKMSFLVFCSQEVGGLPFRIADILNRHGSRTVYISVSTVVDPHDSTRFHYGERNPEWDLSGQFGGIRGSSRAMIDRLDGIIRDHEITGCFATGEWSYLLRKAGTGYRYWSFGSDLDQACFAPLWPPGYPRWKKIPVWGRFAVTVRRRSRKSLRSAESVMIAPYQKEKLDIVCPGKKMFFLPHFQKVADYEALAREKAACRDKVARDIRAGRYFFSSTRHVWTGPYRHLSDNKENDVIIRSMARYLELSGDKETKLVLVKKGVDAGASMRLAQDLGIKDSIFWVDEMPRDALDPYYRGASLCFGQFGTPVLSGAVIEPLSHGTACISHAAADAGNVPFYDEMPPIFDSSDPGEIARFACSVMEDEKRLAGLGYDSWRWVRQNCTEEIFTAAFRRIFNP